MPAWQPADIPDETLSRLPRKIDRVRDALRAAAEQFRPADRFALIAFAGQATTLVPNTAGSDKQKLFHAVQGLDMLQLGDDTYIGRGMALGFEALQQGGSSNLAGRMLVLTDGFTEDEQDCRDGAARARQNHVPISTMGWVVSLTRS